MNSNHDLPIPLRLLKSFFAEGVVAFVGAGLSMNEGLPSWKDLMEKMLSELKDDLSEIEKESVKKHIEANDHLLVADFLKYNFGETRYKNFIEDIFGITIVGKIQQLLLSIPFFGILTTNYDTILSQSDSLKKFNSPFTWEDVDVFRKIKKPFILHVHGIASTPGSTILSLSDYNNLQFIHNNITFWEAIKSIFQQHRVVFIGYSLNDPDFNLFLTKLKYIFPGNLNEHHVLIVEKENDPLNLHRLKQILGINPICINCSASIGESIFNWLNKIKLEANSILIKNKITLLNEENKKINSLKDSLVNFLIKNYFTNDLIYDIFNSIDVTPEKIDRDNIYDYWSKIIFNLSQGELRKLMVYLLKHNNNDALIKRILSHLPE